MQRRKEHSIFRKPLKLTPSLIVFVLGLISLPISDAFIEAHKKGVYSQTVSHVDNIIEVIPERKSGTRQRSTPRDQQDFTVRKSGRGMVSGEW